MWRPRQPLSKARRVARAIVWSAFAGVLWARYALLPPEVDAPLIPNFAFGPPRHPPHRFHRRPPTPIAPPQSEVPKDLLRIHIQVEPADAATLRSYAWNGWRGQTQERPDVLATVQEGGRVYPLVELHLKGAAGSFRQFDDKPALTLNFTKHDRQQRFHGFSKLSLNNSAQDPTFICETLTREMFELAGVPAPRTTFATVLLNGVDKGLYVLVEGYNKDFLRRHFSNVRGNLYDGGFCQDIDSTLAVNSGDRPGDRSDLDRLAAAAATPEPEERWRRLHQVLDVERFISLVALEVLTCHWDGYAMNRNNYRLFHDLDRDQMVFMPHGVDQMFDWPVGRFPPDSPILPGMNGMVAEAVMNTPEGRRRFLERLGSLSTNQFSAHWATNRVHELARRIRPTLAAYSAELAESHDEAVASLCERITLRFQSVVEQLRNPEERRRPKAGEGRDPFRPPRGRVRMQ